MKIELYQAIEQAIREHSPQLLVPNGTTKDDIYHCIRAIMRANPDIFWFSHQWTYTEDNHTIHFRYTIGKKRSLMAKSQIEDVIQHDFAIKEVLSLPKLEQIMYIFKWIPLYCQYNIYAAYNQTIYSVFVYRNSVCTGYAKAAQYLFDLLGIESRLVFGTMTNAEEGSRHCWLIIKVNDQWYHFDPTFASPSISHLLFRAGVEPIYGEKGLVYNYFCCDTETIKQSRMIEDENNLPSCKSSIGFIALQGIPVQLHRTEWAEPFGVKGCELNHSGLADIFLWHSRGKVQTVLKQYKEIYQSQTLIEHEARVMSSIAESPYVIHFYGVTRDGDGIVIEQATPLADLLCCHYYHLSSRSFCTLLLDLIRGLQDCIEKGIYYRDIHLNNIFRTSEGRYVLGGFGSAVFIGDDYSNKPSGIGSPWYLAPEALDGRVFNESCETYGVGMLAYFLLNYLRPPLWRQCGKDALSMRLQGCKLPPPALLTKESSRPFCRALSVMLQKALSWDPELRYQKLYHLEEAVKYCLFLANDDDFLLINGGSYDRLINFEETVLDHVISDCNIVFESTCIASPDIFASNGEDDSLILQYENGVSAAGNPDTHEWIDDFAISTMDPGPWRSKRTPVTFQPNYKDSSDSGELIGGAAIGGNIGPILLGPILSAGFFMGALVDGSRHKFFGKKNNTKFDDVYSSVFAPAEIKPKSHLLVQVFLHLLEEAEKVASLATEADHKAERRDYIPLQCKLKKGDIVDVSLYVYGETLLESFSKSVIWQGSFTKCSFDYLVPGDIDVEEMSCKIMLTANGIPVGEMLFITSINETPKQLNTEIFSHRYNNVFISYAHKDESKVKFLAEGLELMGVPHFFDRRYLKAGDIYPQVIRDYIDSADLFILCWSENASKSDYVKKEMTQALERAFPQVQPAQKAKLSIYPMSIEPRAELPAKMKDNYHFGII